MSSILRACMSNMLLRMRDKACDARLRRCRMPMAVSRAAFCLLTIVATTGLWGWSFEPFAIVGWNAGLPVISWLSCAVCCRASHACLVGGMVACRSSSPGPVPFGMRLWKSDLLVVLPAVILLLRGSALWGSLFLLVGCALWLPLAVSLFSCDAGSACLGAGQGKDEAFEVPPHLPVRRSPLVACCISPFGRLSLCCDAIKRAGIRRWDCPVGLSRPACGRSVVRRVLLVRGRRVGAYLPRSPLARRAHPARLLCMRLMDAGRGALGSVPRLLWGVACICGRRVHLAVRDAPSFRVCRRPKRGCGLSTGRRRAFNLIGTVVRDGGE